MFNYNADVNFIHRCVYVFFHDLYFVYLFETHWKIIGIKYPVSCVACMDRVRRLSLEVLEKHRSEFGEDFAENKQALNSLSIVRSKGLKNEIAGYITKVVKNEIREIKNREEQERARIREEEDAQRLAAEENSVFDENVSKDESSSESSVDDTHGETDDDANVDNNTNKDGDNTQNTLGANSDTITSNVQKDDSA